ncbi:hypothetical protein [Psychromarinibacter halotolerans]|uniref:VanZ like protein n=1 Tax=Psychromarinibacter halotolerans TaxID=1775175 RepID=A0ABV7GMD9_9RHOB|nr:hypothetical protein [Psychromarinibacter halotolerans]MDF0596027.1 hypothetical protein [Psychromarinibacter halotolerans]
MFRSRLIEILKSLLVSLAIYPVVLVGVWGLIALGSFAADMHMPADTMPLIYGLVFAGLTVALIDILGVASVVLALVSSANLIEYAQLLVPGREASTIDFVAGLAGVIVAATLVCSARALLERQSKADLPA